MNNLFILYETYTNGYKTDILDIISLLAILCGILVIISKNPIVCVPFWVFFVQIDLIVLDLSFTGLVKTLKSIAIIHGCNIFLKRRLVALSLPLLPSGYNRSCLRFYSTSSEFKLYVNYKDITSEVINKLLIN